jgi:hypothetical protein
MTRKTRLKFTNGHIVRSTATSLILAQGCATTHWVRRSLRSRGYRASQAEVSDWLATVARQEGWLHLDNGLFRLYFFGCYPPSLN